MRMRTLPFYIACLTVICSAVQAQSERQDGLTYSVTLGAEYNDNALKRAGEEEDETKDIRPP